MYYIHVLRHFLNIVELQIIIAKIPNFGVVYSFHFAVVVVVVEQLSRHRSQETEGDVYTFPGGEFFSGSHLGNKTRLIKKQKHMRFCLFSLLA